MKREWPTLEGRLRNGFGSEREALEQLQRTLPLSEYALKRLEKCIAKDKKLQEAAKKVKLAVDNSPNHVTLEQAKEQVKKFRKPM